MSSSSFQMGGKLEQREGEPWKCVLHPCIASLQEDLFEFKQESVPLIVIHVVDEMEQH